MTLHAAYGDLAERERRLRALANAVGAQVWEIGASVEGRPILAVRVSPREPAGSEPPRALVHANIHGVEWISAEVALGFLGALERPEGEDLLALRARAEIVVVPTVNPDGAARTERQGGHGTLKELRTNAHGVDLNRNFPRPHGKTELPLGRLARHLPNSGSDAPARATYRGTAPLSEPEAHAMDALCQREGFKASVGLHSFMGTLIPPCVTTRGEAQRYAGLCQAFRSAQRHTRYPTFASRHVDVLTGELEDRLHHDLGCTALTVESYPVWRSYLDKPTARSLFDRFNPDDPGPWVDNDVPGIARYLRTALGLSAGSDRAWRS